MKTIPTLLNTQYWCGFEYSLVPFRRHGSINRHSSFIQPLRAPDHRQSPVLRELINQMSCHIDYSFSFMEQNQLLLLTVKSAYLLTFKLYCVTEVDSLLLCLSQPRNFEEYKAHIALHQKPKGTCVISSRVRVVLHVVPNLWKKRAIYLDRQA